MHERQHLYIDGAWVEQNGDGTIQVVNPANEGIIGSVPVGSESDANAAVEAARRHSIVGQSLLLMRGRITSTYFHRH